MKTVIINENQKGLLFKNGRFVKLLDAGKYYTSCGKEIEKLVKEFPIVSSNCSLETLLKNEDFAKQVTVFEVGDEQLGLHYVNGKFENVLGKGKHAFFNEDSEHSCTVVDISTPYVDISVPTYIFSKIPAHYYVKVEVAEHQKARLYFNRRLERVLDAGTYYFWRTSTTVAVEYVDMRLTQMDITGQEILTQDKVSLRINVVCNYRVTDCVKIYTEVDDFAEQLHVAAQLALRDFVGKHRLDEILECKDQLSKHLFAALKAKEASLYVEVTQADVKDIILPGEIRDIMNTVLVAEKRAQANVITRREEVASTRSLLNTARLMEENATLYRLKELEYIERICENVGNISLSGSGDLLSQLTAILRGDRKE